MPGASAPLTHPLDSCARIHLDRRGRVPVYFACGVLGVIVGAALVVVLAGVTAVPVSARAALIAVVAPQLAFLLAVKAAQVIAGRERIVMYEMALAALAGTALALAAAGEPVRPGLDLTATGIIAFLAVARLGCLQAGCCHGRPARRGIAYGPAHAAAGFPRHLLGVRLFPLPLVEAGAALAIAAGAALALLRPHAPGEVTAQIVTGYGLARFALELLRGDTARPHALGLSEAQWIALGLAWPLALWSRAAGFAAPGAYLGVAALLTAAALALAALQRRWPGGAFALAQPLRLRELAQALEQLAAATGAGVTVVATRGGLRLSGTPAGAHLTVSGGGLTARGARLLSRQIAALTRRPRPAVRPGRTPGVFHLLFADAAGDSG